MTAREQLLALIRQSNRSRWPAERLADALAATRVSVPCPICEGKQTDEPNARPAMCEKCAPTGMVPGGSLLVEYAIETGMLDIEALAQAIGGAIGDDEDWTNKTRFATNIARDALTVELGSGETP